MHTVVVLVESDGNTLDFVRDDGTTLGTFKYPSGVSETASAAAAGRYWYVSGSANHLHSVTPDGMDTDVASLADLDGGNLINGLAVSSDGQRWAWGVLQNPGSSNARTWIDVGGMGVATKSAIAEATNNPVLIPLAWTLRGIVVSRSNTGIGGCCYLTPETAGREVMLVDPGTLMLVNTFGGCASSFVSAAGSFACAGSTIQVHTAGGSDVAVAAQPPVSQVGWAIVDDAGKRVVFAVIHSTGGGGDGPYVIDTEQGDLTTRTVTKLFDQATPDYVLPDGRIIVSSAPQAPNSGQGYGASLRSSSGSSLQLGPQGSQFRTAFPLSS